MAKVELSLPAEQSARAAAAELCRHAKAARSDAARAGLLLLDDPVDDRGLTRVPLRLQSPRYLAMQRHFDTIGPAGRRMMRLTASTQVCLDWWPGAAGLEQWRVLNLVARNPIRDVGALSTYATGIALGITALVTL